MKHHVIWLLLCLVVLDVAGKEWNYLHHMCLNPVLVENQYVFNSTNKEDIDLKLVQITQLQRHLDRWIYEHDLIDNLCWTSQLNSTDARMRPQCLYNLSSIWASWPRQPDPYSAPATGYCTTPQLTRQGQLHARQLGVLLRKHLLQEGGLSMLNALENDCRKKAVSLEFSNEQKNQQTAQNVYLGLCSRLPSIEEFPYSECVVPSAPAPNTPFFLNVGVCNTSELQKLTDTATESMNDAAFIADEALPLANWFRLLTGHSDMSPPATKTSAPTWLDNLIDCSVVHQCHQLKDLPPQFRADNGDLLGTADLLETRSRVFPFDFFASNRATWLRYTSLYYGYYFYVLLERMHAVIFESDAAIPISIQVMSDSNISPLLKALRLDDAALLRPVWGSTLVFELYHNGYSEYFVRVVYNGKVQILPGPCQGTEFCHFDKFVGTITPLMPTQETCPVFFDNFEKFQKGYS